MKRAMPRALGRSSTAIKASHDFEMDQSARVRPHTRPDPEISLKEPQNRLSAQSQASWT